MRSWLSVKPRVRPETDRCRRRIDRLRRVLLGVWFLSACATAAGLDEAPVRLEGRFALSQGDGARFTWPGSALTFRFEGTRASLPIRAEQRTRFWVDVDGETRELWVAPGEARYRLAQGLAPGVHRVRLTRLAESFTGVTVVNGLPETDGELLPPPEAPERKLLVIGDSITAGYGALGESRECGYSQATSSPLEAYAGLAATDLQAQVHTIAWSGIGVWRGYGEKTPDSPTIAERRHWTLGDQPRTLWDPARYRPDAVIVGIGTNDFWTGTAPGYRRAMERMLEGLRSDYPEAPIYLMVSPMLTGEARKAQAEDLASLAGEGVSMVDWGRIQPDDGYGCDWHPNTTTHRRLADNLVRRLSADLGW